ncbi:MAG: sulfotransferase family 2 domain-containing protein [Anaerolineae bacterium]|nr:sulfotransferase family 2 domain-containing protein [Anaerolineae bacterium]
MIISHTYKYLFVELPHTGSTAISRELREHYDGQKIIRKHANYLEFLKIATPEEKEYFVFSCIRNPLDETVSHYYKFKNNHKGRYTDPNRLEKNGGRVSEDAANFYNWVQAENPDFRKFMRRLHQLPYDNMSCVAHKQFDYVIRFEDLGAGFAEALHRMGIEPVRPLPLVNKTEKKGSFLDHYTPDTYKDAKRIFGPFMEKWDYEFPAEWGAVSVPWWAKTEFNVLGFFRRMYWGHLRGHSNTAVRNLGTTVKKTVKSQYASVDD